MRYRVEFANVDDEKKVVWEATFTSALEDDNNAETSHVISVVQELARALRALEGPTASQSA